MAHFVQKSSKEEIEYWITQFNMLRKTIKIEKWSFGTRVEYIDLEIYSDFLNTGFLTEAYTKNRKIIFSIYLVPVATRNI